MRSNLLCVTLILASSTLALGQTPNAGPSHTTPASQQGVAAQPPRPQSGTPGRAVTDGPVWRIAFIKTKPGKTADHMRWLREYRMRVLDGQKSQGLIVDYKYFTKPTSDGPNDWDIAEAVLYKNYGDHLDFDEARTGRMNEASIKVFGTVENRTKIWAELRDASRDIVSSQVVREMVLRPMN